MRRRPPTLKCLDPAYETDFRLSPGQSRASAITLPCKRQSLQNPAETSWSPSLPGCDQPPAQLRHRDLGHIKAGQASWNSVSQRSIFYINLIAAAQEIDNAKFPQTTRRENGLTGLDDPPGRRREPWPATAAVCSVLEKAVKPATLGPLELPNSSRTSRAPSAALNYLDGKLINRIPGGYQAGCAGHVQTDEVGLHRDHRAIGTQGRSLRRFQSSPRDAAQHFASLMQIAQRPLNQRSGNSAPINPVSRNAASSAGSVPGRSAARNRHHRARAVGPAWMASVVAMAPEVATHFGGETVLSFRAGIGVGPHTEAICNTRGTARPAPAMICINASGACAAKKAMPKPSSA
ncbi:MAG TPA: hypothetical protein VMU81_23070 [Acetobacteraceae bacterium]|nr:hypothetical protein [Acetobacteraceae bacterium]